MDYIGEYFLDKINISTSMHYSRTPTTCLLTVSWSGDGGEGGLHPGGGGCIQGGFYIQEVCIKEGGLHLGGGQTLPLPCEQNDRQV